MTDPFLIGVNYWPCRKAMYWWKDFDRDEVRRDFAVMRDWGIGLARFFLLWEDFQPEPGRISARALDHLCQVMAAGEETGVKLMPTLFTGHMSGCNWMPEWALDEQGRAPAHPYRMISGNRAVDPHMRDIYTDSLMLAAASAQAAAVARVVSPFASLWAVDLGNEPSQIFVPAAPGDFTAWVARLAAVIREVSPATRVMVGTHLTDIALDNGYNLRDIAPYVDFTSMHAYPDLSAGPDVVPDALLPAFSCLYAHRATGKPTLCQEFGLPVRPEGGPFALPPERPALSETAAARFYEQALPHLVEYGAIGAMPWCFSDYDPALYDLPPFETHPHECHFGMFRADGSPKSHARVIRAFAASCPLVQAPPRMLDDLTPATYRPNEAHFWRHEREALAATDAGAADG